MGGAEMNRQWNYLQQDTDTAIRDASLGHWGAAQAYMDCALGHARKCHGCERFWARRRIRKAFFKLVAELEMYAQKIDAELAEEAK